MISSKKKQIIRIQDAWASCLETSKVRNATLRAVRNFVTYVSAPPKKILSRERHTHSTERQTHSSKSLQMHCFQVHLPMIVKGLLEARYVCNQMLWRTQLHMLKKHWCEEIVKHGNNNTNISIHQNSLQL